MKMNQKEKKEDKKKRVKESFRTHQLGSKNTWHNVMASPQMSHQKGALS